MKVLVTGGAGFIGSHVVEALRARGDEVSVLDDFSTGTRENLLAVGVDGDMKPRDGTPCRLETIAVNVRDASEVARQVGWADAVIHLAARANISESLADPALCHAVNVGGTVNVLAAAAKAGVRRVVIASSSSVYGMDGARELDDRHLAPMSPYAASKLECEILAETWARMGALDPVCLRFFNVYGPRQRADSAYAAAVPAFVSAFLGGTRPVLHGDGRQTRDFVYVKDVAAACLAALDAPAEVVSGRAFDVGTGREVSIRDLLRACWAATFSAAWTTTPAGPDCPEPESFADLAPARPGDAQASVADVGPTYALGWAPSRQLINGLRETAKWALGEGR